MSKIREYWVRNTTNNDLLLHDLRIAIPAQKSINIYQRRPSLTEEQVAKSRKDGKLAVCLTFKPFPKLIELPAAPPATHVTEIEQSMKPIPSRVKSSVLVNPKDKDYVEVMEEENMKLSEVSASKYADYADGIADPISIDSDNSTFKVVSVQEAEVETVADATKTPKKAKIKSSSLRGKGKLLTIDAPEAE